MKPDRIKADKVLDTRGLEYPMPLLKTLSAIRSLPAGRILEVWCADSDCSKELMNPALGKEHECLFFVSDSEGFTRFFIQKNKPNTPEK